MSKTKADLSLLCPVQVQTSDTIVLDALARFVTHAGLKVGDRLPSERELGERLQVSRNTVREALKRWETLNIVQRRKGSGTFLRVAIGPGDNFFSLSVQNNVEQMLHSLELRRALESEACALAAARATDEDIQVMRACIEEVERVSEILGSSGNQDWAFHCSIYRATHNPMFEQVVAGMYEAFHAFFDAPPEQEFASSSIALHRELFEAISAGNSEMARLLAHRILDTTEQETKQLAGKST